MNINRIKLNITVLFTFCFLVSFAQKEFQGKAYYFSKTTFDMSNFGARELSEERKKQIAERMKSVLEKTYILTFNQTESIYLEEEKLDAPNQVEGGRRFGMMNSSGGYQYKNVKDQQFFQENEFFGKQFLIKDSLPKLNWELGTETKTIGQYMCFKATAVKEDDGFDVASFIRRDNNETSKDTTKTASQEITDVPKQVLVTAWYTPQIPVNQGPEEYWGLPGLILEISTDKTTILCSKIVLNPSEKEVMKVPSKGQEVTKKAYNSIVKQKMEEMRDMYRGRGERGGNRR